MKRRLWVRRRGSLQVAKISLFLSKSWNAFRFFISPDPTHHAVLFELTLREENKDDLKPLPFKTLADMDRQEEDLEQILDDHLHDTLYQQAPLMTFFRQRSFQGEADLYALNRKGEVVLFELKREGAEARAVQQLLRYSQEAGQWSYADLAAKYRKYTDEEKDLQESHRETFGLEEPLDTDQFNRHQKLRIVGNAADTKLIEAVEYWTGQGLDLSFVPYRIYEIEGSHYFEFFAKPNDRRINPADRKGVLFDTNRSYNQGAVWDMIEKKRVAAYGGSKDQADYLNRGDIVFYYDRGSGVIAGAKVTSETKEDGEDQRYHDVEFLTPVPRDERDLSPMSPSAVEDVTGASFYWARTVKYPYLTCEQAEELLGALRDHLAGTD
jgi:hypothetical protein